MARGTALLIGATGQVGYHAGEALAAAGWTVVGTGCSRSGEGRVHLDLLDEEALVRVVKETRPAVCVLAAAMTNVEGCEAEPAMARAMNSRAPEVVAKACRAVGGRTLFLSTEYVFDGSAGPYSEEDLVNPLSVYGRTKLDGETAVLEADPGNLVVRTTVVYSYRPGDRNFLMQVLERLARGERMRVPTDQLSSPTYAPALGEALAALAQGPSGVLHVAGPQVLGRYEFGQEIARAFGLDPRLLEPVKTAQLGQRAQRPLVAGLNVDCLRGLGLVLPGPADGLEAAKAVRSAADHPQPAKAALS